MRNWTKRWRRVTWKGFPAFKHERESYDLEGKNKLVVSSFISSLSPSTTNTEGLSEEEERILLEKVLISSTQIRCKCGYGLDILNSDVKGIGLVNVTASFIIHFSQNRWRPCLQEFDDYYEDRVHKSAGPVVFLSKVHFQLFPPPESFTTDTCRASIIQPILAEHSFNRYLQSINSLTDTCRALIVQLIHAEHQ